MDSYNKKFNELLNKLRSTRKKETLIIFFDSFLKTITVLLVFLLIISLVEMIAHGDETFRGILIAFLVFGLIITSAIYFYPAFLRYPGMKNFQSEENIALRVGDVFPEIKDKLCNSIQLISDLENPQLTSQSLSIAAFDTISEPALNKNFDLIIDKKKYKRAFFLYFIALTVVLTSFGVFNTTLGGSLYRLVNWNKSFTPPAPFTLHIEPINANAMRGDKIIINVKATGEAPDNIMLYVRELQQENYDVYNLRPDSIGVYHYEISSLKNTIIFHAESPWMNKTVKSEEGTVVVNDKPTIRSMSGTVIYPNYTRLNPKTFDEKNADISALKGSTIDLNILSGKNLSSGRIVFIKNNNEMVINSDSSKTKRDTLSIPLSISGNKANGKLRILNSGVYYVTIKDKNNQENTDPIKYNIYAQNDEYPTISMIEPTTDIQITGDAMLPMRISITDDYGFSSLKLFYKLTESKYAEPEKKWTVINVPFSKTETASQVPFIWDLKKLDISPQDKFEYYFEVCDNDNISGPKSAKTNTLSFRLPSLDEVIKDADKEEATIEKELKEIIKQSQEVQKNLDELNQDLMKNQKQKELNWEEKKKAQDLMKQKSDIADKLNQIQQKIEQMSKSLDENKMISKETLDKYMELQKLMQEVSSPELKQLQQQMQKAMEQLTPEQMQKAMKDYKFNEEQFKQSIERSLNILKRLKAEQQTDALTKRAEDLAKKQDELQKQVENSNPNDQKKREDLAREQKQLKDEMESISKELKDLEKIMKEIGQDMPMDELNKAKDALDEKETSKEMQDAQNQSQNGDFNKAQKSQKSASSKLKKFAQQMQNLKKEMKNRVTKEAQKKMQKSINDMISLSQQEEKLKDQTSSADYNSTQIPQLAKEQADILQSMKMVANSMVALSQKTFAVTPEMGKEIGNSLKQMQNAISQLSERQTPSAAHSEADAMKSMNNATKQMQNMLSSMQNQGQCDNPGGTGAGMSGNQMPGQQGQGSFSERLQQLAGEQQALNQAMQESSQGNGSNQEQQAKMKRMASQQSGIQKSLEELNKEQKQFANNPNGEKKQGMGSLDKIAEDMKQTVSDLQSGRINQETVKRQDKILSRMLDATRSINDRDYEKKRESKTGKEFNRESPAELKPFADKQKAMNDLLHSIQEGYTKDYETLIRKYFEAIQNNGDLH